MKGGCTYCTSYVPHYHPERLENGSIPSSPIVFVYGTGEITFCDPEYVRKTIDVIRKHNSNRKYYFQSKNPKYFKQFIGEFEDKRLPIPHYAVDMHTRRGRNTGLEFWFEEGSIILNEAPIPNTYSDKVKELIRKHGKLSNPNHKKHNKQKKPKRETSNTLDSYLNKTNPQNDTPQKAVQCPSDASLRI